MLSDDLNPVADHRPDRCVCCGGALHGNLFVEVIGVSEQIDLPLVAPVVTQHRRLAIGCPSLWGAGRRAVAGGGARHAAPSAAARGGDLSQDFRGSVMRAAAGGAVESV